VAALKPPKRVVEPTTAMIAVEVMGADAGMTRAALPYDQQSFRHSQT
jgi:hypothetical protein